MFRHFHELPPHKLPFDYANWVLTISTVYGYDYIVMLEWPIRGLHLPVGMLDTILRRLSDRHKQSVSPKL